MSRGRGAGLVLGGLLDAVLADPARGHPVAGFGWVAGRLERVAHRDSRLAGAVYMTVLVAGSGAAAALVERAVDGPRRAGDARRGDVGRGGDARRGGGRASSRPQVIPRAPSGLARAVLTALVTWTVVGGTSLRREGRALGADLARADLAAARRRLPALCGRDPSALDTAGLSRAGVESVAENTSDAVVGPLLWGAVAGLPGLVAYRALNTLDAMVGHRGDRYGRFGWAAARADDLANLLPARVCALLACACAPVVGGSPADAFWVMRRDGRSHPSPNAGMVEAAFAGALGLRLGGELRYSHGVEHRPELGFGRRPAADDLAAAAHLSAAVTVAAFALSATTARALGRPRARVGGAAAR